VISSDHLAPGEAGQIRASINTAGRKGRLEKHVRVYSNDRANPLLSLTLTMEVVQQ